MIKKIILSLFLLSFSLPAFAQEYSIGIMGGMATLNSPVSYTIDISKGGLGFEVGECVGLKARYQPAPGRLSYTCQLQLSHFSSDDYGVNINQNFYKAGAGVEWAFLLEPENMNPYLAFDLYYSRLGDVTMEMNGLKVTGEGGSSGANRVGLGFGGGFSIILTDFASLDLGAKVNVVNLLFRDEEEKPIWTALFTAGISYSFN